MFYGHAVGNVINLLIASIFISIVLVSSGVNFQKMLFWNILVLIFAICVFVTELAFKKVILDEKNAPFWLWLRIVFGSLAALLFGISAFLLMPDVAVHYEMYILIILIAISSLTLSSYAVMLKYSCIMLAMTLLPYTLYLLTKSGIFYLNLVVTVIIIQIVLLMKAVQMSESAVAALYLQEKLLVEIEDHKATKKHLDYLVNHDALTRLPNRHYLITKFTSLLERAVRNNSFISVLYIDLNGFKAVNDKYGHAAGDELLIEVAKRLKTKEGDNKVVARLGGDEFVIILVGDSPTESKAHQVRNELMQLLTGKYLIGDKIYNNIGASIGISNFKDNAESVDSLLKEADMDMYRIKRESQPTVA